MRRLAPLALATLLLGHLGGAAAADGPAFRRTTPRAALAEVAGVLLIGVPSGRAWGIESELRPLPGAEAAVVARLRVDDPAVREAFVRVAYYATATARTRQLAIVDSPAVPAGHTRFVVVLLDPPPGAVAYRVRVLARLAADRVTSRADGIEAVFGGARGRVGWAPRLSRLLE